MGEELGADQQAGGTGIVPRTVNDLVEERLFARRRDLFSELSVVFLDTTSLSFTGADGRAFEIDPGRLADEARFDGIFVLRSNARIKDLRDQGVVFVRP